MSFDILGTQNKAVAFDLGKIRSIKVLLPVKGNIASLYHQILPVFYDGFYHLADYRPQVGGKRVVLLRCKLGIAAADQSHFQVVDG